MWITNDFKCMLARGYKWLSVIFVSLMNIKYFFVIWKLILCMMVVFSTGNLDWVGEEFLYNAGAALVVNKPKSLVERNSTVVDQLKRVFNRDWRSLYAKSLQPNKSPTCSTNSVFTSDTLKSTIDQGESPNASLWGLIQ